MKTVSSNLTALTVMKLTLISKASNQLLQFLLLRRNGMPPLRYNHHSPRGSNVWLAQRPEFEHNF